MVRKMMLTTCLAIGVAQGSMVCTTPEQDLCGTLGDPNDPLVTNKSDSTNSDGAYSLHSRSLFALAMGMAGAKLCGDSPATMPLALASLAVGADGAPRRLGSGEGGGGAVSVLGSAASKTAPTCATTKKAYQDAGCCDATDKTTREVSVSPVYRSGCKSQISTAKSTGPIVGGSLYVFDPNSAVKEWKQIAGKNYVDLAESSIAAGCTPKHKPHMVRPSPNNKFVILTYTGDQDFAILQSDQYKVVGCPTVDFLKQGGALKQDIFGGATHDGAWYTDDHFLFLDMTGCIDGTCGGGIYRFNFSYSNGKMTAAEFDRALGMDGVKAARQSSGTKPISLANNPLGAYAHLYFVTDAKGAGSIMDANSMTWVKHFNMTQFGNCGTGGLWVEPHPTEAHIVIAQYGKQGTQDAPGQSCLFTVDMKTLQMSLLKQLRPNVDAHGLQFCTTTGGALTLINSNRQDSSIDVISYPSGDYVVKGYNLNTEVFNKVKADFKKDPALSAGGAPTLVQADTEQLQPDMAILTSGLSGGELYMSARGPKPVSAVMKANFRDNAKPGAFMVPIDMTTCKPHSPNTAFALPVWERSPQITADVHGIWTVNNEIWAVDQAGTGSVQSIEVYSACAAAGTAADKIQADPLM